MIKSNKMIGVGVLLLAILMAGAVITTATSTTSNDAPAANVGPGAEVEIMNFTIEDGGDLNITNDSVLSPGANLTEVFANVTSGNYSDWKNVSSYDAEDGDDWNASVDFLYINNSGTAAFNNSSATDYVIGGNYSRMNKNFSDSTNMTYGGFDSDWDFTSLDADDNDGDFNVTIDAIIIDGDNNGFYQDNFTEISIVSNSEDNPINYSVIDSINISNSTAEVANNTIDDTPFSISLTDENITADTTYTVNMTLNETLEEWDEDYYNMLANATLTLASGDETVVNDNTIMASHIMMDKEYYAEEDSIEVSWYNDTHYDTFLQGEEKTATATLKSYNGEPIPDNKWDEQKITLTYNDSTGAFETSIPTTTKDGTDVFTIKDGFTVYANMTNPSNPVGDVSTVDISAPTDVEVTSPDTLQYNKSTDTLSVDYGYIEDNPYQTTIQFVNSEGVVDAKFVQDDASEDPDAVTLDLSNPDEGSFEEGCYSIKLSVEDAAGNVNNTEMPDDLLMIDETGPSVVGDIANNITETENFYDGYYNNSFAFNLTFVLEDNGEIDENTVILHYNNSTSESTIDLDNTTIVNDTATFNATITDEDNGMADNTTIEFWLEADDTVGNTIENGGNASNPLVSYTVDTEAPNAPDALSAEIGVNCIELDWTASTDEASGVALYNIYRNNSSINFVSGDCIGNTSSTSYKDESVVAEEKYNYTIEAVDNLGHVSEQPGSVSETYKPGAGEAFEIVLTASRESIIADGRDTTQIDATVEDKYGEQVNNFNISFSTDAGTLNVTDGNYYEVTEGSYTVTLTSAMETGVANVTASLEGTDITNTTQVEFVNDTSITFDLRAGWNMMSLPLIPADSSIETVLEGIDDGTDVESVWAYDAQSNTWTSYDKESGGELEEMVDGEGYFLKTDSAGTMNVSGYQDTKINELPQAYDVYEGWNLIGFKYNDAMHPYAYLGRDVAGSGTRLYTFGNDLTQELYSDGGINEVSQDKKMQPGKGYWLAVSQDGTISAPGYIQNQ